MQLYDSEVISQLNLYLLLFDVFIRIFTKL